MYELQSCEVCRYYKPRDGDPPPSRGWPQRGWCTRRADKRTLSDTWCRWFVQKKNEKEAAECSSRKEKA